MTNGAWSIAFFTDTSGRRPVNDFLAGLDAKSQARFIYSIEQLRLRNIQAREPLVKHLGGKIWELRRESGTNIYRLLYVFLSRRRVLFLHGFMKKTQKTPRNEIETALRRLERFMQQEGE